MQPESTKHDKPAPSAFGASGVLEHEHGVARKLGAPVTIQRPLRPVRPRRMIVINDGTRHMHDAPTLFMHTHDQIGLIKREDEEWIKLE